MKTTKTATVAKKLGLGLKQINTWIEQGFLKVDFGTVEEAKDATAGFIRPISLKYDPKSGMAECNVVFTLKATS